MKYKYLLKSLIFLPLTLCSFSCINKDYDINKISHEVELNDYAIGLPIGSVNHSIEDFLKKWDIRYLSIAKDMIYLTYKDSISFDLGNQIGVAPSGVSQDTFVAATGVHFTLDVKHKMEITTMGVMTHIDSAALALATATLKINSSLPTPADFEIKFPKGITLADPKKSKFTINPGVNTFNIDIKPGSILHMETDGSNYFIKLTYNVDVPTVKTINAGDIKVDFSFSTLKLKALWGFMPDIKFDDIADDIAVDFFENILPKGSKLNFHNPTVKCEIRNYAGITAQFDINYLKSSDDKGNTVSADFGGSPTLTLTLPKAIRPYDYVSTFKTFDKQNGGIHQLFFKINPKIISYSFALRIIAKPGENHFVLTDKFLDIVTDIQLPFSFDKGTVLLTKDTFKMDSTALENKIKINDIVLRVKYANRFPIHSKVNVVFLDSDKKNLSAIAEKTVEMKSSAVDANGYATNEVNGTIHLKFDKTEFENIPKIAYIVLKTNISASNNDAMITLHPKDYIRLKADLFLKADAKF